ncbi:MAG: DUF1257 domain-containing protein [Paraclostridium sp.]
MSVWKRLESRILESNIDRGMLELALKDLEIGLDNNVKTIKNSYGTDSVDAGFIYKDRNISMGISYNKKGGVELVGDIWGTGLGRDGKQDALLNKIAQAYQKRNVLQALDMNGWTVESTNIVNGKVEIEVYQL